MLAREMEDLASDEEFEIAMPESLAMKVREAARVATL
jgi:hypothetical protein